MEPMVSEAKAARACMRPQLYLPVLGHALRASGDIMAACSSFGRLRYEGPEIAREKSDRSSYSAPPSRLLRSLSRSLAAPEPPASALSWRHQIRHLEGYVVTHRSIRGQLDTSPSIPRRQPTSKLPCDSHGLTGRLHWQVRPSNIPDLPVT